MTVPTVADHLLMVLPGSRERALTYAQLAHRLYNTPYEALGDAETDRRRRSAIRACQEAVAVLRDQGIPVCGGDEGLWFAQTAEEAMAEYRRLRARALGQIRRASRLKAAAFAMKRGEIQQLSWTDAA